MDLSNMRYHLSWLHWDRLVSVLEGKWYSWLLLDIVDGLFLWYEFWGYDSYEEAQRKMTPSKKEIYTPKAESKVVYDELYALYMNLHDGFGGVKKNMDYSGLMKKLLDIKERI